MLLELANQILRRLIAQRTYDTLKPLLQYAVKNLSALVTHSRLHKVVVAVSTLLGHAVGLTISEVLLDNLYKTSRYSQAN